MIRIDRNMGNNCPGPLEQIKYWQPLERQCLADNKSLDDFKECVKGRVNEGIKKHDNQQMQKLIQQENEKRAKAQQSYGGYRSKNKRCPSRKSSRRSKKRCSSRRTKRHIR